MTLLPLNAGPLTMVFDTDLAFLRYIHLGETELLRGIFAAIRDADWNTLPFSIDELQIEQTSDSFGLRFQANGLGDCPMFQWHGQITGSPAGVVEFRFRGIALRSFLRNRIGLCVLHPTASCADQSVRIEHVDGSITQGAFPKSISPHQPFENIRSINHSVSADVNVCVSMLGDTFEMEDQRNWTDASYKTYSTPLALPFPVEVASGTRIEQMVQLKLMGSAPSPRPRARDVGHESVRLEFDWNRPIARPKLGFAIPPVEDKLPIAVIEGLRRMQPDHLRVDLWLDQAQWQAELRAASELARACHTQLELALFVASPFEVQLQTLVKALGSSPIDIARILLFDVVEKVTPSRLLQAAQQVLHEFDSNLVMVVGTNAYFAELNRGRPAPNGGSPVCYSINPQVHAFDKLSMAETLAAQADTVDSAAEIFSTDVVVSPVTLRPRFNPNATSQLDRRLELAGATDPRQASGFVAAWTAGVLANLATHPRLSSLTLFETHGPRGVMDGAGQPYALTPLLEHVLQCQRFYPILAGQAFPVAAIGVQPADQSCQVILGNLSSQACGIEFLNPRGACHRVEVAAESVQVVSWDNRNNE